MSNSILYHRIMCLIGPLLAVLGHNFSIWLKFSGGQGIAVFTGILMYSNPLAFVFFGIILVSLGAFTKLKPRYVGLVSVLATVPFALFLPLGPPWGHILTDWVVGPNGFIYLTQGLLVFCAGLGLLVAMLNQIIRQTIIGVEKMTE